MEKVQEITHKFVFGYTRPGWEVMPNKSKVDSVRVNGTKRLPIEIYEFLNSLNPDYLSVMFEQTEMRMTYFPRIFYSIPIHKLRHFTYTNV